MDDYVNWREEAFKGQELKSCPFCGFKPDIMDEDCIYPGGRERNEDGSWKVWNLNCYETGGGCGATVYAPTAQATIEKWNHRIDVTINDNDLKNCPFCDSEMNASHITSWTHEKYTMFEINCPKCKTEILADNPEECVSLWNSRAGLPIRDWDEYETELAIKTLTTEPSEKAKAFYNKMAEKAGIKKEE